MAIQPEDSSTLPLDIPSPPPRRGRPSTGKAMTPAERKRAQRDRDYGRIRKALDDWAAVPDRVLLEMLLPAARLSTPTLAKRAWQEIGRRNGYLP